MKYIWILLAAGFFSCHGNKPKPVSNDFTKVKVSDSGHMDSVVDNKPRLYNASISEPCLKCVVGVLRNTEKMKPYVSGPDSGKIVYEVDWYWGPNVKEKGKNAGSGLLINVFKNTSKVREKLAVYMFDNVTGQLSFIDEHKGNQDVPLKVDSVSRVKIRNACFWGVASKK